MTRSSSITRIDSLRRKIARRLLKKNNLKPLSRFSSLFTCHNHTTPYPMIELSWDESLTLSANCTSKPDRHHQVVHLLGGFIFVPSGQRNASANAWEFIIIPLTLVFQKEITISILSSVSFDRETRISDWFNTFRAEVCGNRVQRKECRPRQSYWNSKSGKEDNNPMFIVSFKKISSSKCCFKLKKLKTTFNAKNRRKSPPWRILIFDKATKKRKTIEKK